jgi:hypothetical protein
MVWKICTWIRVVISFIRNMSRSCDWFVLMYRYPSSVIAVRCSSITQCFVVSVGKWQVKALLQSQPLVISPSLWTLYHRLWHLYADSPPPCIIRILSLVVILKTLSSVRGLLIKLHIIGFHNLNGWDSQVLRSRWGPVVTGWWLNYRTLKIGFRFEFWYHTHSYTFLHVLFLPKSSESYAF